MNNFQKLDAYFSEDASALFENAPFDPTFFPLAEKTRAHYLSSVGLLMGGILGEERGRAPEKHKIDKNAARNLARAGQILAQNGAHFYEYGEVHNSFKNLLVYLETVATSFQEKAADLIPHARPSGHQRVISFNPVVSIPLEKIATFLGAKSTRLHYAQDKLCHVATNLTEIRRSVITLMEKPENNPPEPKKARISPFTGPKMR